MKIPPIDLRKFIQLLKSEGQADLSAAIIGKLGGMAILKEWHNILAVLEKEVIPLLSKGCEAKSLLVPAQKLAGSAKVLGGMAANVLSFVPGPVGIICSLALAIGCFSTGNIVGGFFELLGCIPGGKVAGKSASKLFPKIEKLLIEIAESNQALKVVIDASSKQQRIVAEFFERHAPKIKSKSKPEVGYDYGVRTPINTPKSGNMPSLEEAFNINMAGEMKTHICPKPPVRNYYYPESTNSMIYRLSTNMGKGML